MKIGELAKAAGYSTKAIRFYEQEGLLPAPPRTASDYRVYGEEHVRRLEFVRKAKRLGLSLEEIKGILRLHDREEATCLHVHGLLDQKVAQADRAIRELQEFRAELVRIRNEAEDLEDCQPSGGQICGIIEASQLQVLAPIQKPLRR